MALKIKIKLGTVNNAALFSAKCNEYSEDIDFICGKYMVDSKSLMGVLSVGLDHACEVDIHTCDRSVQEKFKEDMKLWVISEKGE